MTSNKHVIVITGTRKGIGKYLAEYYVVQGFQVIGCSRGAAEFELLNYEHFTLDVSDDEKVTQLIIQTRKKYGRIDVLLNNAGIASMNHFLLTPTKTVREIYDTNVLGTFLFCREAAKVMQKNMWGRIVNFATVATPLKLEGESIYASSKAAIVSMTEILARELAEYNITVNAVGSTPVKTDLVKSVPEDKMTALINRQAIKRFGEFRDITNVIDFLISKESDFVTGQVIYLGGV